MIFFPVWRNVRHCVHAWPLWLMDPSSVWELFSTSNTSWSFYFIIYSYNKILDFHFPPFLSTHVPVTISLKVPVFLHTLDLAMATWSPWRSGRLSPVVPQTWTLLKRSWKVPSLAASRERNTTTLYSTRSPRPPWLGSFRWSWLIKRNSK